MYETWMDNTPIFGKINDIYIEPDAKKVNSEDEKKKTKDISQKED